MEGTRGRKALGRSFGLVKGRWWPTFGALVLAFILVGIVSAGLTQLLAAFSLGSTGHGSIVDFTLRVVTETVSSLITTPFTAALTVVLYIDLRVRKEGFDVQLLAAQIGLEPGSGRAGARSPERSRGPACASAHRVRAGRAATVLAAAAGLAPDGPTE